jgi:hypothetical protein
MGALLDPEVDAVEDQDDRDRGPRIRCPLCNWSPSSRDLVVHVRPLLEHFRHRRRLSGVSVSVGVHAVPSLWSVVAALRLVRTVVGGCRRPAS